MYGLVKHGSIEGTEPVPDLRGAADDALVGRVVSGLRYPFGA